MILRAALFTLFCFCSATSPASEDWPQFLGPERNGISLGKTPLIEKFADAGPKRLWKKSVGSGFAGPVVSGDLVIMFHRNGNEAVIEALTLKDGAVKWTFRYETNYKDSFGFDDGPRTAPTIADGRVFAYGAEGQLHALELATGKLLWKRDAVAEFQSDLGYFGRAGAPLVVGSHVLVNIGGPKGAIVSFDVKTGKTNWQTGDQASGYASPLLWKSKLGDVALFLLREGLMGVAPEDGKIVFQQPYRAEMDASVNAATPVLINDTECFTSACYDTGAALWKRDAGTLKALWQTTDRLDAHYTTPLYFDGHLFGMHGRQEMGMELRCILPSSGKIIWQTGRMPAAEIIIADRKLLLLTEKGELIIAAVSNKSYEELDREQILSATHRSAPALAHGILYARDRSSLVAIDLRK
jgi:outer membrane protein assembly factor BamB